MKTLFLRIFVWFWLAMAAVAVLLVISSPFFTRGRPRIEEWQKGSEQWIRGRVDRITSEITTAGFEPDPSPHRRRRSSAPIFLFDNDGDRIFGPRPEVGVRDIALRALAEGEEVLERNGAWFVLARPMTDPKGRHYVVAAAYFRPPKLVDLLEPKVLAPRLLALALVAGLVCFPLARFLSSPVRALGAATRRLAEGELSTRVEPKVKKRRDEIGELARDFDAMAERVETLVSSQQRLLRDVSHELRSPLTRLGVALELARSAEPDKAGQYLDRAEHESDRLNELIRQLLTLTRLEHGPDDEQQAIIELDKLLADVVSDADFEARAKECRVEVAENEMLTVCGNPQLLGSALDNILRNAVRHTKENTTVEVSATLKTCPDRGAIGLIRICDHGPGVNPEHLEDLFTPFFRVEDARDRLSGGAGLGLAIAARAVKAHNGSIRALNRSGDGLVVEIELPVHSVT